MYRNKNLQVMGTFSHLTSADSQQQEDLDYTSLQLERFDRVVHQAALSGCQLGQLHIQGSYGILNYSELSYDIARPGTSLYGLLSDESDEGMLRC